MDFSGDNDDRESALIGDKSFEGAAGITSFLHAKREPILVVENNTVECTTWARDDDPRLIAPAKTEPSRTFGLRRSAAGENGRPIEALSQAGGVADWVQNPRHLDAAPGFDDARKSNTSLGSYFYGM